MTHWEAFNDHDLTLLWQGIDTAYWYPNKILRSLLDEMIERGIVDGEANYAKRLLHETVRETA